MPLGKRTDLGNARFAGLEVAFCCDIVGTLEEGTSCGFDFVIAPLVHPRYRRPKHAASSNSVQTQAFTRSDLLLTSGQWSGQVVGSISPWICPDSTTKSVREDSCFALKQELDWALHLGLQAVVLSGRAVQAGVANTAMIIHQMLEGALGCMAVWVKIPLGTDSEVTAQENGSSALSDDRMEETDPWMWWNSLRQLCHHHSYLGLMLELPETLPSDDVLERYYGESVKALVIPTRILITNKKGFPTLSKRHQQVVETFLKRNVQLVLSGPKLHGTPPSVPPANGGVRFEDGQMRTYWEYLSFLFRRITPLDDQALIEIPYRDKLQAPLEPLRHNLESQTYEVFERDDAKYDTYEEAICRALSDWPTILGKEHEPIIVMVVGAGRGPLVRASLKASKRSGRTIKVYAVEKNPNAVVTLLNRAVDENWGESVTVVPADMRQWHAPEKADILVSELLGSFGDNELSPECLDGAQRFLKEDGISIPSSYTSYLAPATAFKTYDAARAHNDLKHVETAYCVKLHNYIELAKSKEVFTFCHPNRADVIDNSRYTELAFYRSAESPAALMHGFAGYFETVLYKDITLCTVPEKHTPKMQSWFPIFFPLAEPIDIPRGATQIVIHIWRCMGEHKVWYEWCCTSPVVTPIQNSNGRSHWMGQ
ncbi:hypothetical protein BSKO_00060 [Bryopsis sp. KO-2023]|nr:hypothetical protein BSKO_00060 [Bryopsis sp. KO-2023]